MGILNEHWKRVCCRLTRAVDDDVKPQENNAAQALRDREGGDGESKEETFTKTHQECK